MLKKVVEVDEEKPLFQLFFLKNEDQSVEVVEVEGINFREVQNRLKQAESVFITLKRKQKLNSSLSGKESVEEPWYFART